MKPQHRTLRDSQEFIHRLIVDELQTGELSTHATDYAYSVLINGLAPLTRFIAAMFPDLEDDDIASAAHEAIIRTVDAFNPKRGTIYSLYGTVLQRKLNDIQNYWNTGSNRVLTHAFSLSQEYIHDEGVLRLQSLLTDPHNYIAQFDNREELRIRWGRYRAMLSDIERDSLIGTIAKRTYEELAKREHCTRKAIDNAICRAKEKRIQFLDDEQAKEEMRLQRSNRYP